MLRLQFEYLDTFIVVNTKINKTALAKLYGHVDDPKITEKIEKCEAMGKIFATNTD